MKKVRLSAIALSATGVALASTAYFAPDRGGDSDSIATTPTEAKAIDRGEFRPATTPATTELAAAPVLQLADSVIETFHDGKTDTCNGQRISQDGPVRVFEDQYNVIHMTVSNADAKGWQWTGSVTGFTNNPKTAALDCTPVMIGNVGNTDVSQFDQKTWIQAHFFDGTTVHAYGHQDYWGGRTKPNCHQSGQSDGLPYCWYASIATWQANPISSANRHLNFTQSATAPGHIAIYPMVQYPGDSSTPTAPGWIGYGAPSNIFRGRRQDGTLDGFWYIYVYANSPFAGQTKGVCLFRSANPADRTSWRAWNGSKTAPQFTQAMVNPYSATSTPCATVEPTLYDTYLRSVIWHKPSKHYISVLRKPDGVYYSTSTDLLSWSAATLLLQSDSDAASYPVLIDFDGGDYGDDNFDRAHDNGKLYLFYRKKLTSPATIRITRRKINISNYAADPSGPTNPN